MKRASLLWFQIVVLIVSLNLLSCGGGGGGGGIPVETDDEPFALAIDSSGNLVTAGYAVSSTLNQAEFALARYTPTGSLDTTFNTTGTVTTVIGDDDAAYALAIDSNGKLVAAGTSLNSTQTEFALVRYNTDGSLDTSFGTGGIVTTAIGTFDDEAMALAIQSDGKLVAAGISVCVTCDAGLGQDVFALVRYNTDGSLDTSFGTGGIVTTAIDIDGDDAFALAIQPSDGKLVAAGGSYNDTLGQYEFALVRYNTDGSLDTSFNTTGIVRTAVGDSDEAFSLAIQSDGKLVAAGDSFNSQGQDEFALARYNTDGSLDTTGFGTGGTVTTAIGIFDDEAKSLAIDSSGNLVAAGFSSQGDSSDPSPYVFALARYTAAGVLDTTFGTAGIVTTAIGTSDDEANALAIDSSGNLVATGFSFSHTLGQYEFALARYTPTAGALDATFGTAGIVTTAIHP